MEAHRRAIALHEDAAELFDRLYQADKSRAARERAQRAREMLRLALSRAGRSGAGWGCGLHGSHGAGRDPVVPRMDFAEAESAPRSIGFWPDDAARASLVTLITVICSG